MRKNIWKKILSSLLSACMIVSLGGVTALAAETDNGETITLATTGGPEAFAVYCANDNSLTFYTDNAVPTEGSTYNDKKATEVYEDVDSLNAQGTGDIPWYDYHKSIASVVFDSSFKKATPISFFEWFTEFNSLTSVSGVTYIDTSNVTSMYQMFFNCESLASLDLSEWDTSNVTNMSYMFGYCDNLTSLNLRGWDTSSVTNMYAMFCSCSSLTNLDLSGWDTSNVTTMGEMFSKCSNLTAIDLSGWGTSSVTSMYRMFYSCTSLTSLDLSSFDTRNVESRDSFATGCTSLRHVVLGENTNIFARTQGVDQRVWYDALVNGNLASINYLRDAAYPGEYWALEGREEELIDISECTVQLSSSSFTYDGSAKTPSVTVTHDGSRLVEDTDYTVDYSNNINAGTATVTIIGKDYYKGSVQQTFTIDKAEQTLTASIDSSSIAVGQTAAITTSGVGTITYQSEDVSVATVDSRGKVAGVSAGTVKITVTAEGNDNYNSASKTITVTVTGTGGTGGTTSSPTVKKDSNGKWYYYDKNGKKDSTYTGFASNSNGKWYVEKGVVTFKKNDVIKDASGAIGSKGTWYYVVGSEVQENYTGVANYKNSNGWWYIKNGKVDFNANTVAKNKSGWWYVTGGKVQFGFTGLANYSNANGWWYIKNGKVDFNHNGIDRNKNGWWYVNKGKVNFNANTVAKNSNGWWYILGGKVQFDFTGLADYSNANGWWYIKSGKVDFSHNGVDKNKNGWWYVEKGKVNFNYTGVSNYSNANGWWYIKNGKVDFSFNGTAKNKNGTWKVVNGKVDFSATYFSEVAGEYVFASGAGNWYDEITVHSDGTYSAEFQDINWGQTGSGYPNGAIYLCDYSGKFSSLEKVNSYTYSTTVLSLNCDFTPGTEEIKDGILYIYDEPALAVGDQILFYLPGTPLSSMPSEVQEGVEWARIRITGDGNVVNGKYMDYILYDVTGGGIFFR